MIIGLRSHNLNNSMEKMLTLWTLKTVLSERKLSTVLLCKPSELIGMPEYIRDNFTIVDDEKSDDEDSCLYDQIPGYLSTEPGIASDDSKKPCFYPRHPLMLLQQIRYHSVADMPQVGPKYVLADFSHWDAEREALVKKFCAAQETKQVVITALGENDTLPKLDGLEIVEVLTNESTRRYLGYMHVSTAVITDRYMSAALCVVHQKRFLVLDSKDKHDRERTEDLFTKLELTDQLLKNTKELPENIEMKDIVRMRELLYAFRKTEMETLEKELPLDEEGLMLDLPVRLPKNQCIACGACEAICPENAVEMVVDEKGYLRPQLKANNRCSDCDLCVDVCVKKTQTQQVQHAMDDSPAVFVARHADMKQKNYAYSGIFKMLIHFIIAERDGIVFGTTLNKDLQPEIVGTENEIQAAKFAQVRYMMPNRTGAFRKIKEELDKGRAVMFAGLPCECAGLRSFLRTRQPRLIIVEFLCHGVSSRLLHEKYVKLLSEKRQSPATRMDYSYFPAKTQAEAGKFHLEFKNGKTFEKKHAESDFYQMLEGQVVVDECCRSCTYSTYRRVGDITLGYLKEVHSKQIPKEWRGMSILIAGNKNKGYGLIEMHADQLKLIPTNYSAVLEYQYRLKPKLLPERQEILNTIEKDGINTIMRKAKKK